MVDGVDVNKLLTFDPIGKVYKVDKDKLSRAKAMAENLD